MNADEIIKEIKENACEWLEMSDNPEALVSGILANQVIQLKNHIEYLERRLKNDSCIKSRAYTRI